MQSSLSLVPPSGAEVVQVVLLLELLAGGSTCAASQAFLLQAERACCVHNANITLSGSGDGNSFAS